ncbi:ABC transporter permease [Gimibacter soli]|uniref:FtsX-like permease family protein n=1 Tax=Gimibacter soli TaxID=3024400 RepID=A0AAF0BN55_9PROT|nr:FtsX-like permease family protein [Gimibacter soli]WCL55486.1 FtsX-like permease family protein [Gimibacter soli]
MSDLYLIFKNLTRRKLRLSLTLFAIFVAFLIFGVLSSFNKAFNSGIELSADDRMVVVNKINFTQPLPIAYVNKARAIEGVDVLTWCNWFGGYYQDPKNFIAAMACDAETLLDVYPEIVLPEDQKKAFMANRQGLIAGQAIAVKFGWKVGDRIPMNSNIFSQKTGGTAWDFDVEGIYTGSTEQFDTNSVYFHYKYFDESRSFGKDYAGWLILRTTDPALNDKVANTIDTMFANSFFETSTDSEKAFNKAFIAQIGNIAMIVTSVVGAAFFTILLIVGNTMVLAIRERTGEIAVMKTLGFPAARIFKLVLGESLLLSLIGGLLGIGAAWLIVGGMKAALAGILPTLVLTPDVALTALAIMVGLGFLTGIVPALSAHRLNIITAMSRQ